MRERAMYVNFLTFSRLSLRTPRVINSNPAAGKERIGKWSEGEDGGVPPSVEHEPLLIDLTRI